MSGVVAVVVTDDVVALHWAGRTVVEPAVWGSDGGVVRFGTAAVATCDTVTGVWTTDSVGAALAGIASGSPDASPLEGVVRHALGTAGVPERATTIRAACPSRWSPRRRGVVATALRRVAAHSEVEPIAPRAAACAGIAPHERAVVVEFGAVGFGATEIRLDAVDGPVARAALRDLDLTTDEVDGDAGAARVDAVVRTVSGDIDPDVVVVVGSLAESAAVGRFDALASRIGRGIRFVPVPVARLLDDLAAADGFAPADRGDGGSDTPGGVAAPCAASPPPPLLRLPLPSSPAPSVHPARSPATAPFAGPGAAHGRRGADERAEDRSVRRSRLAVAAVVVVALAAVASALYLVLDPREPRGTAVVADRSVLAEPSGAAGPSAGASAPTSPRTRTSTPPPRRTTTVDAAGARLDLPDGWHVDHARSVPHRAVLLPRGGADRRIVVTRNELVEGTDRAAVEGALTELVRTRSATFGDLDTNATYADRPVFSYVERPDEFSTVRWYVVIDRGTQLSVGCQFLGADADAIRAECAQAVGTIAPL